jgi:PPOX class probable F420-dependent enzyme
LSQGAGQMGLLNDEDRDAFLSERRIGVLAIERADAGPLTAPIWYRYTPDGGFEICMANASAKAHLLRAAGRASICVQQEAFPYTYVTADGPVEMRVMTGDERDDILREIAKRYLGEAGGNQYADAFPGHDEALVTLRPTRWRSEVLS